MTANRAFTLVELVLAVGITAVLAALLLGIVTHTLGIWQRGAAGLQLESAGGLVLDRIAADLDGWVALDGAAGWRRSGDDGAGRSELRFFSLGAGTGPTGSDGAGVRLVVYVRDKALQRLYRWESTATASLEVGYDLARLEPVTEPEWLLGENIRDFAVRWRDAAGAELPDGGPGAAARLVSVEVTLIDAAGRARLDAVRTGASTESSAEIEGESVRTLTRWIALAEGGGL